MVVCMTEIVLILFVIGEYSILEKSSESYEMRQNYSTMLYRSRLPNLYIKVHRRKYRK